VIRLNDMFGDIKTELEATLRETGRRERFLADVVQYKREDDDRLPSDRTVADRVKDLRSDVETAQAFKSYIEAMPMLKDMTTVPNGYGRVDAFGVARNLLFGGDERNRRPQNAPRIQFAEVVWSRSPFCGKVCRRIVLRAHQRRWLKTPKARAYKARNNREYSKTEHGRMRARIHKCEQRARRRVRRRVELRGST
jgi:hypothetical protein